MRKDIRKVIFDVTDPHYQGENYDANVQAAQAAHDNVAAKRAKPGQIALAWLLQKGEDIVLILSTKHRKISRRKCRRPSCPP